MADIFLSYSHENKTRIIPLVNAFEKQGWTVFWDRRIPAGKTWRDHIGRALTEAKCVVVLWSVHSITSKWVTEEADDALRRGLLVPILIDNILPPLGFRSTQAANLVEWQPELSSEDFNRLIKDIGKVLDANKSIDLPLKLKTSKTLDKAHNTGPSLKISHKIRSKRNSNILVGSLVVGIIVLGFLVFQLWGSSLINTAVPELSGLVFASKVEANGQAIDPKTTFPENITDLYAVFRSDMPPPGMKINVDNVIEGAYYSQLKVTDNSSISSLGWRWYFNGEKVNEWNSPPVEVGEGVWLQYFDYGGSGIFSGELGPGTYTIVILLDGNPAMSSELIIEPIIEKF